MHLASAVVFICGLSINSADATPTSNRNIMTARSNSSVVESRRILQGKPCGHTRPYMVYLRPLDREIVPDRSWTCGGAIIHPMYILTSAACIEDAKQFLVISGTSRWVPNDETNECVENGQKKAVAKCVPKEYVFDGQVFDNSKWMRDDIAIVRVDEEFNFQKKVRGCDFIPEMLPYNNITENKYETPGTIGSIAGWGITDTFDAARGTNNSLELLEVDVNIISNEFCKKLWNKRYHHIIDHNIICTQDTTSTAVCGEKDGCAPLSLPSRKATENGTEEEEPFDFETLHIKTMHQSDKDSRRTIISGGGFCNNDHGGPLIVGQGKTSVIVGIISACQHNNANHRCFGPYLYTSVWKNKHLIDCLLMESVSCPLDELLTCCKLI